MSFHTADAQDLPFPDGSFDLVVCQFGVMFFPDKIAANREARRVLAAGRHYLLVTFDRLEHNPVPKAASDAVARLFREDPPDYMERGPFSYADPPVIEHDLLAAGFADVRIETVASSSRVDARNAAQGLVLGSPFRAEIERRDRRSRPGPGRSHRRASSVGRRGRPSLGTPSHRHQGLTAQARRFVACPKSTPLREALRSGRIAGASRRALNQVGRGSG